MKTDKTQRIIFRSCFAISYLGFIIICVVSLWFAKILSNRAAERAVNCATFDARPIPEDVVRYLCNHDLIPASLGECGGDLPQIQVQDVGTIVKSNVLPNVSTVDDVSQIFGIYEVYCEQYRQNQPEFRCTYDVGGVWPRVFIFYSTTTNVVGSIREQSCGGGS